MASLGMASAGQGEDRPGKATITPARKGAGQLLDDRTTTTKTTS
jgi:hypothetical protein